KPLRHNLLFIAFCALSEAKGMDIKMKSSVCKSIPRAITGVWAPADCDLQGYCPHCGADVTDCFNKAFCEKCGKKIEWLKKEE
ncbi:hypothetical protein AALB39_29110, partial [Lachnospiraceae bacterium 54-53]